MAMKQFNLDEYREYTKKHGEIPKLVTRDGDIVRIVCSHVKNKYPICYIITGRDGSETVATCATDGTYEGYKQLFFADIEPAKYQVPLDYDDLFRRLKDGKTMWVIDDFINSMFNIVDFDVDLVYYVDKQEIRTLAYIDLFDKEIKFADGTPCWKEVEREEFIRESN